MTNYILINPVASVMYKEHIGEIHTKLQNHKFKIVEPRCQQSVVKEKYKKYCDGCDDTVLDNRCPAAIEFIYQKIELDGVVVPKIEPILIHTARDLYKEYLLKNKNASLTITTPCESLKILGKEIFKKEHKSRIYFKTWNEICDMLNIERVAKRTTTPIPMGFFKNLEIPISELSGALEIEKNLKSEILIKKPKLVEILYCKDGCHNGDGV